MQRTSPWQPTVCWGQLSRLPSVKREMSSIVVTYCWLWVECLVWLIGAMMCLLAALWVQSYVSADNGWPHIALRHHWLMPISCHFRDCKALLVASVTRVSSSITSVQTFTFNRSMQTARTTFGHTNFINRDHPFTTSTQRRSGGCIQKWTRVDRGKSRSHYDVHNKQVALLSQRGRAMLRVCQ